MTTQWNFVLGLGVLVPLLFAVGLSEAFFGPCEQQELRACPTDPETCIHTDPAMDCPASLCSDRKPGVFDQACGETGSCADNTLICDQGTYTCCPEPSSVVTTTSGNNEMGQPTTTAEVLCSDGKPGVYDFVCEAIGECENDTLICDENTFTCCPEQSSGDNEMGGPRPTTGEPEMGPRPTTGEPGDGPNPTKGDTGINEPRPTTGEPDMNQKGPRPTTGEPGEAPRETTAAQSNNNEQQLPRETTAAQSNNNEQQLPRETTAAPAPGNDQLQTTAAPAPAPTPTPAPAPAPKEPAVIPTNTGTTPTKVTAGFSLSTNFPQDVDTPEKEKVLCTVVQQEVTCPGLDIPTGDQCTTHVQDHTCERGSILVSFSLVDDSQAQTHINILMGRVENNALPTSNTSTGLVIVVDVNSFNYKAEGQDDDDDGMNSGFIIVGCVVGGFLVLIIIVLLVCMFTKKDKRVVPSPRPQMIQPLPYKEPPPPSYASMPNVAEEGDALNQSTEGLLPQGGSSPRGASPRDVNPRVGTPRGTSSTGIGGSTAYD